MGLPFLLLVNGQTPTSVVGLITFTANAFAGAGGMASGALSGVGGFSGEALHRDGGLSSETASGEGLSFTDETLSKPSLE